MLSRNATTGIVLIAATIIISITVGLRSCPASPRAELSSLSSRYSGALYREADGLPQSSVKTILQSKDGYVWLGTQEGLCRFDGHYFKAFTTTNTLGLPSQNVHKIVEDAAGAIWIHAGNTLASYSNGTFTNRTPHWSTFSGNRIRCIRLGEDGHVYCQTDHRIYLCGQNGVQPIVDLYATCGSRKPTPLRKLVFTVLPDGAICWIQDGRLITSRNGHTICTTSDQHDILTSVAYQNGILWCSGKQLYNLVADRLVSVACAGFPSDATGISVINGRLWVQSPHAIFAVDTAHVHPSAVLTQSYKAGDDAKP